MDPPEEACRLCQMLEDVWEIPPVTELEPGEGKSAICCCRTLSFSMCVTCEWLARHPTENEVVLLQEADVPDSPHGEPIDLKKLEQDALQRQVALSQLTVSIRDAAALLAAQPSFKAAARLSLLRGQLADVQVGDCGVSATLLMLLAS